MMTSMTTITSEEKKQCLQFVEDATEKALEKVSLDRYGVQKLIENNYEFQSRIMTAIRELSMINQFANEEVHSSCTYPKEYKRPKRIKNQINAIATIFNLDPSHALEYTKNLPKLPDGAEGWFAIPSANAVAAKYFPRATDDAEKYCRAIQLVHEKIAVLSPLYNYRKDQIATTQLRVHARTAHALDLVTEKQEGDILIIAAQLGRRHRGRSVRRAREVFVVNEFGLTSLMVGSIILTHPERLIRWARLDMDCSGDEFDDLKDNVRFARAPIFYFNDGVRTDMRRSDTADELAGSASGFVPE